MNPASQPKAINADRETGIVTIDWSDGHRSIYGAVNLRLNLPLCVLPGRSGSARLAGHEPTLTTEQTQLVAMRLCRSVRAGATWGDGHDTGYYTFDALRRDCPCSECAAARRLPN